MNPFEIEVKIAVPVKYGQSYTDVLQMIDAVMLSIHDTEREQEILEMQDTLKEVFHEFVAFRV